ncbi:MAG: gamma carbonic anhydrase family protein [Burkholderiales bacterium]|nr:gamma carbonic anhydrase family protein [Burkholderiales bacterium]
MAIYRLGERVPDVHPSAWVAESAQVIGKVKLEENSSIWFNVTLRGDNDLITIGANSNVQEGSVLHTDPGLRLNVGAWVTVGHQAMLHGCTIGDGSLIGMQAIVLNGARIGRECLIGAGALIPENKEIPDRSVVMGAPGKVVRQLSDEDVARIRSGVQGYVERARLFREQLVRL